MSEYHSSCEITISKRELIQLPHPGNTTSEPKIIPLSILDATTAKFTTTSVVWFYESAFSSAGDTNPLSVAHLRLSLLKTLSYHPWLTGRLDWAHSVDSPFDATSHEKRFRRLVVTYGDPSVDRGASFIDAVCRSHRLSELIPSPQDRCSQWDPTSTGWNSEQFLPDLTTLALNQFPITEGTCLGIKVTTFKCGGIGIGIAMSHQIADALTVTNFLRDWSNVNASMVKGLPVPELSPCFLPSLLDAKASGDIDAQLPDPLTVSRARQLPMLRYDHWVDKEGATIVDKLPPEVKENQHVLAPHDIPIPWESWDWNIPVSYRVLHFGPQEIERMYIAAASEALNVFTDRPGKRSPPTRHDALLAHLWQCVSAARMPLLRHDPSTEVFLTTTMGLRGRLSLPASFVGSPLLLAYISRPAGSFSPPSISSTTENEAETISSIGRIASDIHRAQDFFTASAIGDALHDAAFEVCPHRLWQTMCGSRHTLTTSWIHTHTYDDMDFGCSLGRRKVVPWYVHPGVHKPDGQVIIMEVRPKDNATSTDKWYHRGVDVGISLQEDVMERVLSGPLLSKWQG